MDKQQVSLVGGEPSQIDNTLSEGFKLLALDLKKEFSILNDATLKSIKEEISNSTGCLQNSFAKVQQTCADMNKKYLSIKKEVHYLNSLLEEYRMNSKFTTIRINNIPYRPEENLFNIISQVATTIDFELNISMLDNFYRAKGNTKFHPSIVFSFVRSMDKNNFLAKCKQKKELLKLSIFSEFTDNAEDRFYVNENMGKYSYKLFKQGQIFKKEGKIKYIWYRNGRILARKEDNSKVITIKYIQDYTRLGCITENVQYRSSSSFGSDFADVEDAIETDRSSQSFSSLRQAPKRKFTKPKSQSQLIKTYFTKSAPKN